MRRSPRRNARGAQHVAGSHGTPLPGGAAQNMSLEPKPKPPPFPFPFGGRSGLARE